MPATWQFLDIRCGAWREFDKDWAETAEKAFSDGYVESVESLPDPNDLDTKWQMVFTRYNVGIRDTVTSHIQQRMKKEGDEWVRVMGSDRFVRRLWYDGPMAEATHATEGMAVDTIQ